MPIDAAAPQPPLCCPPASPLSLLVMNATELHVLCHSFAMQVMAPI
ncbi:hypothetical protein [Loktanella sp. M215]|nr:hypothetical protein [Loktanella sp. M215]MCF7702379.1 hypothetical protein [Loktanella sp. M215]